jgi:hypothetical protein
VRWGKLCLTPPGERRQSRRLSFGFLWPPARSNAPHPCAGAVPVQMSAPENKVWGGTPTKFLVSVQWAESQLALGLCGPVYDLTAVKRSQ